MPLQSLSQKLRKNYERIKKELRENYESSLKFFTKIASLKYHLSSASPSGFVNFSIT